MTSQTLLVRNGEIVSVEVTLNGRRRLDVRAWRPTTDEVVLLDTADLVAERERQRLVDALPDDCRDEGHVHMTSLAAEVFDRRQHEPQEPNPASINEMAWPDPVDGAALYSSLVAAVRRYVALPSEAAEAVAAWVLLSHAHDCFDFSPLLLTTSAERSSGKTRLLEVVGELVHKPVSTVNISEAALFRLIEDRHPTIMLDEADNVDWRKRPELVGLLNGGFLRATARIHRCFGEGAAMEVRDFDIYCPKAVALLKADRVLPDTTLSRSVVIRMQRRNRATEMVERFHQRQAALALAPLRRQAARWAVDHAGQLREADPTLPTEMADRAADAWSPLFAIADLIGVGEDLRRVALALSGNSEPIGLGEQLLADIRQVFAVQAADRLFSADLVRALVELEGSPWSDWSGRNGFTTNVLARQLEPFHIGSRTIRTGTTTKKGYHEIQFFDAWARYLSAKRYTVTHGEAQALSPDFKASQVSECDALKAEDKCFHTNECDSVTFRKPESGENTEMDPDEAARIELARGA